MRSLKVIVVATVVVLFADTNRGSASVEVDFDLNTGSFVDLSPVGNQSGTYTDIYQSPLFDVSSLDVTIDPGTAKHFWFEFKDGNVKQHLQLTDEVSGGVGALPAEGVIFDVLGTGTSNVNAIITLSGATGSYRSDLQQPVFHEDVIGAFGPPGEAFDDGVRVGEFSDDFPNDPDLFGGSNVDTTNETLYFHDVHLEIFNAGIVPIDITSLQFLAIGNRVEIGEWHIPEPTAFAVWSFLGLAVSTAARRRRLV